MEYYDMKKSGERIRELRKKQGYTQAALAEAIGLSTESVKRLENGQSGARVDTLLLIADQLQASLDYLVLGKEPKSGIENLVEGCSGKERKCLEKAVSVMIESLIQMRGEAFGER